MIDTLRALVIVAGLASFLGIFWWAYAPSRKELWRSRGELGDD